MYPAADGGGSDTEVDDGSGGQQAQCIQAVATQYTTNDDGEIRDGDDRRASSEIRDSGTIESTDEGNKKGKKSEEYNGAHGGEGAKEVQMADEMEDGGGGENL